MLDMRLDPQVKAQDRRRGHRFAPPKADAARVPGLYATEHVDLADKVLHLHYFTSAADWYVAEMDPETGVAFGYADLGFGCGEWGYFDLCEMAVLTANYLGVERDCHWTPTKAGAVDKVKA